VRKTKLHTEVEIPRYPWKIGYSGQCMFIGSCFTENIGQKIEALKMPADINPFGILYNPVSVANGLEMLLHEKHFIENDLIEYNGLWHSFYHHGRFSAINKDKALHNINERLAGSAQKLKGTELLFITFGTAWFYRYKTTGQIVSNCHKIPNNEFSRERLSVAAIVDLYKKLLPQIWAINPRLNVVFTVSPVRHLKDGAVENQQSKATLLLAVDELIKTFGGKTAYFPAYEIVMDELRDYRFYASDMAHLGDVAVNYIWDIFKEAFIEQQSLELTVKIQKVLNAVQHRPFNKNTKKYKEFLEKYSQIIVRLEQDYPNLNLKLEKEYFLCQLRDFG